jgi:Sec-independent protein translocase protein TatA
MADEKRAQQVSLGCGTLILIALIVLIFSGRGAGDLEREVRGLRSEVGDLRKAVEAHSAEIRQLRDRLPPPAKAVDGKAGE